MTPERWRQTEQLYHAALERPPEERASFLDEACAGDEELRREVESLLAFDERAEQFIETPPDDVAAGMIAEKQARSMTGRTLGHYKIQSLLGAGGMGEVYRARDTRLDRDVAVKILPEELAENPEALRRFEREAKAVAALSHPNILAIHDFGTEQSLSYAVMELLEGETLRARLTRSALGWREAVEVGIPIAEGLAAAHARGIIHRDLKPENIFLTRDGQVKILDFGIARVKQAVSPDSETVTSTATKPGTVMGTIGYMSPEQVRGEVADAPSDIFSFGSVLYEMVAGRRPFAGATATEMMAAILRDDPPALTVSGQAAPAELERVIRHCLGKRPEERYQSARDLAFDLKATLSGGSITAPARARRRTPVAVWLGAAVVGLLLMITLLLYLTVWREKAIDSLAVLPLVNASGNAEMDYLSEGIAESLINSLSQLPQLKRVIARSTMSSYKGKEVDPRQVGQELNVRAVFTWKMTQRGDDLIIGAELVNAADGARLWGEQYSRKLKNVMEAQVEIARRISEKLRLELTGEQEKRLTKHYTENPEAYQLYLKGRYHLTLTTEAELKKAVEYFQQAIYLDPNYALAYAGLADAYQFISGSYLPVEEAMPMAQAAARKALELDETLAEAHAALAGTKMAFGWEWAEAEREFRRAIELNSGYALAHNYYGILLVDLGRFDEAQAQMNRARELDPLSPFVQVGAVWPVYFARQYDQAIEQLRKIAAWNPEFANAYINLGWAYTHKGMYEEAIAALNKAKSLSDFWLISAHLGYVYSRAGKRDEARNVLAELQARAAREHISDYGLAVVHVGLGEKDQAFAALEKAFEARDDFLSFLKVEPLFDELRSDPRFTDLLRRMNLAP